MGLIPFLGPISIVQQIRTLKSRKHGRKEKQHLGQRPFPQGLEEKSQDMVQPARKARRSANRVARNAAAAPRPTGGLLRPAVHCPTQRYNMRLRAGKGFTPAEVKAAGWTVREARQFGVAVDIKRRNRSVEGLQANVQRIKE